MIKTVVSLFVMAFLATACGGIDRPEFDSLFAKRPRVVGVNPKTTVLAAPDTIVTLEFSEPIDIDTINEKTFLVGKVNDNQKTMGEIATDIVKGKSEVVNGAYAVNGEGKVASFRSGSAYEAGVNYVIVATSDIKSLEGLPLDTGTETFVSSFMIGASLESEESPDTADMVTTDETDNSNEAANDADNDADDNTVSDNTTDDEPDNTSDNSTDTTTDTPSDVTEPAARRPESIVINEVMYDIKGEDTNGQVFIELYGDPGSHIDGYKVLLIGGDDGVTQKAIEIPEGKVIQDDGIFLIADGMTGKLTETQVVDADLIDNFDPQNGPDCIILMDEKGDVKDALGYGAPIIAKTKDDLVCFEGTSAIKVSAGQSLSRTGGVDTNNNEVDFVRMTTPIPGNL